MRESVSRSVVWDSCNPLPGLVCGILQARMLRPVAMLSFRGPSWQGSNFPSLKSPALAGRFPTTSATFMLLVNFFLPSSGWWHLSVEKPMSSSQNFGGRFKPISVPLGLQENHHRCVVISYYQWSLFLSKVLKDTCQILPKTHSCSVSLGA